jgi:hypothetical protein
MPPGLALNSQTGLISGMPLVSGAWSFTLRVTDADGARDQKNFTINVAAPALLIGDTAIPDSQVESPFTFQLTASGGVAPYRWALLAGGLPPGVALDPNTGLISGTPTQAGTFNFTVSVTDAAQTSASKSISITITAGQLRFITRLLQSAERMSQYSQAVSIGGGLAPYTWSVAAGELPEGLTLDPTTGVISGTPTRNGQWAFSLRVTDRSSASAISDFELMVVDPQTVPRIEDGNYKAGSQKLLLYGVNFDKKGKLLVDGVQVVATIKAFKVIAYELVLPPGTHEFRVITRAGLVSNRFVITVE